jgi:hypothetical protein
VSYYGECTLASVLWMLLDPLLYQGVLAFGADRESGSGLAAPLGEAAMLRLLIDYRF